jgi:hypothetical protein
LESHVDPTAPDADNPVRRFCQVCIEHALVDPHVFAQWAPFIARVNRTDTSQGARDAARDFLARAIRVRDKQAVAS